MENKIYYINDNAEGDDTFSVSRESWYGYKKVILFNEYEELNDKLQKAIAALEEINRKEMNSLRPGGSPSEVARISYEVLKEIK